MLSRSLTAHLLHAAQIAGGGCRIIDLVRIRASNISDADLRDKVAHALLFNSVFHGYDIRVSVAGDDRPQRSDESLPPNRIHAVVQNGVVTLTGHVNSLTHRRMAETLLWRIDGSRRVDNRLEVETPEEDNDDVITHAVRMIFEADALSDATQISVAINEQTVVLKGQLPSDALNSTAARDAWSVPDVREVYNRIKVHQS